MSLKSPMVLTVDDSSDDVLLLRRACQKAGVRFELKIFSDGQTAIEYLSGRGDFANRDLHPLPSLLLLDLKMPCKNGFEVLDWLRSPAGIAGLPVTVFTSSQNAADIRNAYARGADSYLMKPIAYNDLVEIVKAVDRSLDLADLAELSQLPHYQPAPPGR